MKVLFELKNLFELKSIFKWLNNTYLNFIHEYYKPQSDKLFFDILVAK